MGQKWPEARALFQRATSYANKAKNDDILPKNLRQEMQSLMEMIESKQFMAHANSILEGEGAADSAARKDSKVDTSKGDVPLVDRLDEYYEDPNLTSGKPNLYPFPPSFQPIPCKPLFFDLAREHVEFPDLEKKVAGPAGAAGGQQGGSGGWLGGWLGWGKK